MKFNFVILERLGVQIIMLKFLTFLIIKSLNDMDNAKRMAEEGRKFVNENFDVKKMVDDIDTLYDTLL